ncbi:MAG: hypothetical protein AB7P23_13895, partial [Amphiplicatus sp.]
MRITFIGLAALGGASLLVACGNPEKSAEKAAAKAEADWAGARDSLDPQKRLKAYDAVIKDVETIGKKYPKTNIGAAIAIGRSVGGVSISTMKMQRDALAPRADCYAKPRAECLRPFASASFRESGGAAAAPENAQVAAQKLICEKNFAAADKALDNFKINKPAYAAQLVQVALAAEDCGKPDEVKVAIGAWQAAEPSQGASRVKAVLSILSNEQLKPGWPALLGELEQSIASGALDPNTAANATLTLAVRYAELGDAKAALAKYSYFTDTLNYQADWQSKLSLAANLILAGAPAEGLAIVANNNQKSFSVIALHQSAAELGRGVGVIPSNTGAALPSLYNVKSIDEFMAPLNGADKARYAAGAAVVEAEMDKLAPVVAVQDSAIGMSGLDCTYGVLALVHQKLGAPDKATAALQKGLALRQALLAPGAQNVGLDYFAQYQTLLALAQGDIDAAATVSQAINNRNDTTRLIVRSLAVKGEAEKALTLASQLGNGDNRGAYQHIIEGLIEAGKLDKAEEVINAFPGDMRTKNGFTWLLVNKAADEGDAKRAQAIADKAGLLSGPADRFRLLTVSLNNEKVAGDRRKAEPIIREIFMLGEEIDKNGGGGGYENYYAQNAAWQAFHNGYSDLGVELYKAASKKDQRPLFEAFSDKMKEKDFTEIFMLAQDNLSGEPLGYVIDAG